MAKKVEFLWTDEYKVKKSSQGVELLCQRNYIFLRYSSPKYHNRLLLMFQRLTLLSSTPATTFLKVRTIHRNTHFLNTSQILPQI